MTWEMVYVTRKSYVTWTMGEMNGKSYIYLVTRLTIIKILSFICRSVEHYKEFD